MNNEKDDLTGWKVNRMMHGWRLMAPIRATQEEAIADIPHPERLRTSAVPTTSHENQKVMNEVNAERLRCVRICSDYANERREVKDWMAAEIASICAVRIADTHRAVSACQRRENGEHGGRRCSRESGHVGYCEWIASATLNKGSDRDTTIEAAAIRAEEMLDAHRPGEIPSRIRAMKSAPCASSEKTSGTVAASNSAKSPSRSTTDTHPTAGPGPEEAGTFEHHEGWSVTRHLTGRRSQYLKDHRGGTGPDVIEWTDVAADAYLMVLSDAQAYAVVSYEAAYPVWMGVPADASPIGLSTETMAALLENDNIEPASVPKAGLASDLAKQHSSAHICKECGCWKSDHDVPCKTAALSVSTTEEKKT